MGSGGLGEAFLDAVVGAAPRLREELGLSAPETERKGEDRAVVRFEGDGVALELSCDRGEIDAALVRTDGDEDRRYQIRLVLGLAGRERWRTRWPRIVGADTADSSVAALVSDIVEHGGPWLRGGEEALARLEDFRRVDLELKTAQFGADRRSVDVWSPVREAWEEQDLEALVDALDRLPDPEREVEGRAREYAERWR